MGSTRWQLARRSPARRPGDLRTVPARQRPQLLLWTRRLRDAGRRVVVREVARAADDRGLDAIVAEVPVRLAHVGARGSNTPIAAAAPHDRIRLALALAVLDATRLDRSRVRTCGRQGCVLLFFDTSKMARAGGAPWLSAATGSRRRPTMSGTARMRPRCPLIAASGAHKAVDAYRHGLVTIDAGPKVWPRARPPHAAPPHAASRGRCRSDCGPRRSEMRSSSPTMSPVTGTWAHAVPTTTALANPRTASSDSWARAVHDGAGVDPRHGLLGDRPDVVVADGPVQQVLERTGQGSGVLRGREQQCIGHPDLVPQLRHSRVVLHDVVVRVEVREVGQPVNTQPVHPLRSRHLQPSGAPRRSSTESRRLPRSGARGSHPRERPRTCLPHRSSHPLHPEDCRLRHAADAARQRLTRAPAP